MQIRLLFHLTAALLCAAFASSIHAQSSAFTYQGSLSDNGAAADGSYDLQFSLHAEQTNGVAINVVTNLAAEVRDGVFTVTLDFGASVFDGSDRWLEVGVVTNGGGTFSTLSPRQPITAAPVAQFALAGNEGPQGPPGDSHWLRNGSTTYYNEGNVGIGTFVPAYPLEVRSDSLRGIVAAISAPPAPGEHPIAVLGSAATTGSESSYGGYFTVAGPADIGVYGNASLNTGPNTGVYGRTASPDGFAGYFRGGRNYFEGNLGAGISSPQSQLHVRHPAIGSGWGVRIQNASISTHQCGMRLSDDGFFDISNKATTIGSSYARLNSLGVWTTISDRRMKEGIAPLTSVLDRAMSLDPVSFWYINQDRVQAPNRQIGFIAQDVRKLFPSLVTDGDVLTLNYAGLGVVAISALQELYKVVEEKDARVAELMSRLERVEAVNQELEQKEAQIAKMEGELSELKQLVSTIMEKGNR